MQKRVVAPLRIGKEVDVGSDVVVDDEREIGLGGGQFGLGFGNDVRVYLKSDVVGDFCRRGLNGWRETVTPAQGFHLKSIDGIEDAVELVVELGIGFDVEAAGAHEVDGFVEVRLGQGEL